MDGVTAPDRPGRWRCLRRRAIGVALTVALFSTRALAHPGHEEHDDGGLGIAPIVLVLGAAFVVGGLVVERRADLPREYAFGLVSGGAALVLVVAPLLVWV